MVSCWGSEKSVVIDWLAQFRDNLGKKSNPKKVVQLVLAFPSESKYS